MKAFLPKKNGGFPQVSGITFRIDKTIESSVVMDERNQFVSVDGEILSDTMLADNEVLMKYIEKNLRGVIPDKYAKPQGRIH